MIKCIDCQKWAGDSCPFCDIGVGPPVIENFRGRIVEARLLVREDGAFVVGCEEGKSI